MKWLRLLHIKFVLFKHYWGYRRKPQSRGVHVRLALETLGPIFVKFGQLLSTRRDMLPDDIADELAKLQDQVPSFANAHLMIDTTIFESFDETPLASASVAQVHAVKLKDGRDAVAKILRPGIEKTIRSDIALMYMVANAVERFWSQGYRLSGREVVAEFERTIFSELDLLHEAANASQLRRNFLNSPLLHIPEIYWPYAQKNMIVMERIYGIPATNIAELTAAGMNMKRLAERGVEIFFTQVFRDCFFHADMHPGNIFVSPANLENPQYIGVDFGIMGTLSPQDQRYIAENLLAFFNRDYRRVAVLHVESGWVGPETRVDQFESAIRTVCEPVFERPLKDISVGKMLLSLFQAAGQFNMKIQPQLLLLQKTLLNVEGMGRQIYPDLDLWHTAKPYLEKWLREQMGFKAFFRKVRENLPYWSERLPELPDLIYERLRREAVTSVPVPPPIVVTRSRFGVIRTAIWFIFGMVIGAGVFVLSNHDLLFHIL